MNKSDNINKYIILALITHSMFLISFTMNKSVSDITKIGETGMTIQMIILETSDEIYEKNFSSEEIRNKTEDTEKEQQVMIDNRAVGDESENIYDTYYGDDNRSHRTRILFLLFFSFLLIEFQKTTFIFFICKDETPFVTLFPLSFFSFFFFFEISFRRSGKKKKTQKNSIHTFSLRCR